MVSRISDSENKGMGLSSSDNEFKISSDYTVLLDKKLGAGSFGSVFIGLNSKTKQTHAIKMQSNNGKQSTILHESKMIKLLKGETGFPSLYYHGTVDQDSVMVINLLGDNLEEIMQTSPNQKFSMKTSLMIAIQLLTRLQSIHSKGIIHRDLKPENILLGPIKKEKTLHLIDFGLSKRIFKSKTKEHIPYRERQPSLGTLRYISMNTHRGIEQSRRDDLESFGYILVYFILGVLPWQGVKSKSKKDKYDKVYRIKADKVPKELCKYLPDEIKLYFDYVLSLEFTASPNYTLIHSYITSLMTKYGYYNDLVFDWNEPQLIKYDSLLKETMTKSTSCASLNAREDIVALPAIVNKKSQKNVVIKKIIVKPSVSKAKEKDASHKKMLSCEEIKHVSKK